MEQIIQQRRTLTEPERAKGIKWINDALNRIAMRHGTFKSDKIYRRDSADYGAIKLLEACRDLVIYG